jgi:hypothetical protein
MLGLLVSEGRVGAGGESDGGIAMGAMRARGTEKKMPLVASKPLCFPRQR